MSDINDIDLRLIDTTVLLVFLGTMRHRQATAVARDMGLTQPAVSHALKRLRNIYGDPLFLRRAHGLEPTSLAHELEPKVRRIVRLLSETLEGVEDFDPATTTANLRIGAFDYELTSLVPDLVSLLRKESPNINIHAFPLHDRSALDGLIQGQIDLAIGYFDLPIENESVFITDELYLEDYVLAARKNHPVFAQSLGMKQLSELNHLQVSPDGPTRTLVDHALHLQGYKRHIQTVVPSLYAAISIVETSDLVVTIPKRVAEYNGRRFSIEHRSLPIDGGSFQMHAVRHIRDAGNPLHIWISKKLREVVGGR